MASGTGTAAFIATKIGIWFGLLTFLFGRCLVECLINLVYIITCKCCPLRKRAQLPESFSGKTVLITGANGGVGAQLTRVYARLGATVILACRDAAAAGETIEKILRREPTVPAGRLLTVHLDLASLASVRRCAEQVNRLVPAVDVLINNAGVMMCPKWSTEDGLEYQLGVNYLGHFLLTVLLLDKLSAAAAVSGSARVVNVSSIALWVGCRHSFDNLNLDGLWRYNSLVAYGRSKQFVVLATGEMSRRLAGRHSKVTVYSAHPGLVNTNLTRGLSCLVRALIWPFRSFLTITPEMGAQTILFCAFSEQAKPGLYHANCKTAPVPLQATDEDAAKQLWKLSCQLCNIPEDVI